VRGTLQVRDRTCGKPNCRCAKGEKHKALYLVVSKEGKQQQLYIPKAYEERGRQWVAGSKHRLVVAQLVTGEIRLVLDVEPQRKCEDEVTTALRLLERILAADSRAFDVVLADVSPGTAPASPPGPRSRPASVSCEPSTPRPPVHGLPLTAASRLPA
jgi:hypothetical protein